MKPTLIGEPLGVLDAVVLVDAVLDVAVLVDAVAADEVPAADDFVDKCELLPQAASANAPTAATARALSARNRDMTLSSYVNPVRRRRPMEAGTPS
jgi:hypothetical protein